MKKQILGAAGLLTAGLLAGSAFSITAASAADSTTTSTTDSTSTTPGDKPDMFSATSIREGEANVDATTEAKLTESALAEVADATVIRAETDSDGAAYEVHLKNADGSVVTVKFDENFVITDTLDGFAPADDDGDADDDGRHGAHHGPDGDASDDDSSFTVDDSATSSTTSGSTSTED
jgi:hypothetical protein